MTAQSAPTRNGADQAPTLFSLFRNRNFTLLWLAQFISAMGAFMTTLATSIIIFRATGTVASVGLLLLLAYLPGVLLGCFAGVAADRFDRKRIMIGAELLRGLMLLALPFLLTHNLIWLYIVTAASNAVKQFFDPAQSSVIPAIVEEKQLAQANSLLSVSYNGAEIFGLMAAGLLAAQFDPVWAFYVDGLTFLLSAFSLLGLRLPSASRGQSDTPQNFFLLIGEGLHHIKGTHGLNRLFLLYIPVFIIFGLFNAVDLPFIVRTVKSELISGEFLFGLLEAGGLVGFIIGSLFMARWADQLWNGQWVVLSFIGMGLCTLFYAHSALLTSLLALKVIYCVMNAFSYVGRQLLIQRETPAGLLGRVSSAFFMERDLCFMTGMALAFVGDRFPLPWVVTAIGLSVLFCGLVGWGVPGLGRTLAPQTTIQPTLGEPALAKN
ncbi:MAG: MFS transporter [Caldilineaceae bacterium]